LEAEDFPPIVVTKVADKEVISTCEKVNCKYSIITPDVLVIPPLDKDDPVPEDSMEEPPKHG
jgi:hypothetical protein